MPVAERTFSFRATPDLGDRIERARETLAGLAAALEGPEGDWIAREIHLGLLRRSRSLAEAESRSDLIRGAMELVLEMAEKIEADLRFAQEYETAASGRNSEDDEFATAAARVAAERWGAE